MICEERVELIRNAIDEHNLNMDRIKEEFIEKSKKAKSTSLELDKEARKRERMSYLNFYEVVVNAVEAE